MANDEIFFTIIGILFIFTTLITAIFSFLTLTTLVYYWNPQCRSISNVLTCNSSVAFIVLDLSIIIQIPNLFESDQSKENSISNLFCRFRAYLFLFGCAVKIFSYLIHAISRYFIIILYRRRSLLTFRTNLFLIMISWIVSFIIASFMWLSPVAFQYESESRLCLLTTKVFHTSFTLMIIAFVIPIHIIIILYMIILWNTTRTNIVQPNYTIKRNNRRNMKVFQNILILVVILVTGGTPYFLAMIINLFTTIPWQWYSMSILFMMIATAIDSSFLFFTNKEAKKIIYRKLHLSQRNENRSLIGKQTLIPLTVIKPMDHHQMTPVRITRY